MDKDMGIITTLNKKYMNKYRIPSARATWWDYSGNGVYFITICTKNRQHYFGHIDNGEMILSEIGEIAQKCWQQIPEHFKTVTLGEYIIMPNHVHGIITVSERGTDGERGGERGVVSVETRNLRVSTETATPMPETPETPRNTILGTIINQYKRACTILSRKIDSGFAWQSRYYDHIIFNDDEFNNISNYIKNNPVKWFNDTLNIAEKNKDRRASCTSQHRMGRI